MKLLALNGSFRGNSGYTSFLIEKLFEGARAAGATCEVIHLSSKMVKRCSGCFMCQNEAHRFKCIYEDQDDAKFIFEQMRQADLLIFATPVYIFHQSSLLSQLFERLLSICNVREFSFSQVSLLKRGLFFHHIDLEVCSKPFVTLICQDNLESETHKTILSYFKTFSRFMQAPYVGSLIRPSGGLALHGKDSAIETYPCLLDVYKAYHDAGIELALQGFLSPKVMKRTNRPLVHLPPMIHFLMKIPAFRKKTSAKIQSFYK